MSVLAGAIGLFTGAMPYPSEAHGRRSPPVVRQADFSGMRYLALEDVAQTMGGRLQEHPVSQRVDLSFRAHQVQFFLGSDNVIVDGRSVSIGAPPLKDERGFWVPRSFFRSGPLSSDFQRRIEFGPDELPEPPAVASSAKTADAGMGRKEGFAVAPAPGGGETIVVVPPRSTAKPSSALPEPKTVPRAIRRIVIDPGHGGKDPGALGVRGTEEKAVNLWMAQELADELRENDFEILLTRTDDSFVPLGARTALANKYKADLFISVHCNGSLSSRMSGFESYFLSEKASDPHADAVARKENASLEFEGKRPSLPVETVLRSLIINANINRSAQLGAIIGRHVSKELSQEDVGVKQAAFHVLVGAQMPAILIELGFLTNRDDEKRLGSTTYRKRLIKAIKASILEFDRRQEEFK